MKPDAAVGITSLNAGVSPVNENLVLPTAGTKRVRSAAETMEIVYQCRDLGGRCARCLKMVFRVFQSRGPLSAAMARDPLRYAVAALGLEKYDH